MVSLRKGSQYLSRYKIITFESELMQVILMSDWLNWENQAKYYFIRALQSATRIRFAWAPLGVWIEIQQMTFQTKTTEKVFIRLRPFDDLCTINIKFW